MNNVTVEKVNLDTIPSSELEDLRAAEAEAEDFYGSIEKEETERVRLADLHRVCRIMWHNRHNAVEAVCSEINAENSVFTVSEKATILRIASDLHPEADDRITIRALDFINAVSRFYRTMQTGYYFENFPATELLARYAA